jgi:hypothetical protein
MSAKKLLCSLGTLLFCIALFAQAPATQVFPISDRGDLRIGVPEDWVITGSLIKQPPSLLVKARPKRGDSFDVQITAVWLDAAARAKSTPTSIRADVEKNGKEMIAQAIERSLTLKELSGIQTSGYYYSLTDRAPAAGEFKFLVQGIMLKDQVLMAFTILSRTQNSPDVDQALRIISESIFSSKGP